jgi:hypothetical protein
MLVSETALKWAMRFYPPFLLQFTTGFRGAEVKIKKSLFNLNYNKSIFGGTIFSATDPFHIICLHQILTEKGYKLKLWSRKATIDYVKPATSSLYFKIAITEDVIVEALQSLDNEGKFIKTFPVKITNKEGMLIAIVHNEVYIKCLKMPLKS